MKALFYIKIIIKQTEILRNILKMM